jgi:membrane protease YdiL (CAAX protease family)
MSDEQPVPNPAPEPPEGDSAAVEPVEPPKPERYPFWGYGDLVLFFGLAIPSILVGLVLVKAVFAIFGLHFAAPAVEPIVGQFAGYFVLFTGLALIFRLQYDRPFWRSLGWIRLGMSPVTVASLGVFTAVAVVVLASAIRVPTTKNTLTELMQDPAGFALMAVFGVTLAPVCEELAFRGFVQPLLVRSLGAVPGILAAAIPFGLLHYQEYGNSWRHAVIVAAAGAAFGWMRRRTGSTAAAALMHSAYNAVFFVAYYAQQKATSI